MIELIQLIVSSFLTPIMIFINELWEELLFVLVDVLLVEFDVFEFVILIQIVILNFLVSLVCIDECSVIYVEVGHADHACEGCT